MTLWSSGDGSTEDDIGVFLDAAQQALDKALAPYDILGSIAHTQMLHEQGYIDAEDLSAIHEALLALYEEEPDVTGEDVHTVVEEHVTERTDAGTKMHTARSRNDQVALDERLYMKDHLLQVADAALDLADALAGTADAYEGVVMPGYTHGRQAMPTTADTWLGSHVDALLDDLEQMKAVYDVVDQNPLGAAAGYGTTLAIDRERTAELLGFAAVQDNPIHAVNSRGSIALNVVQRLVGIMLTVQALANDLLLFSTEEFGFVELPDEFCTGSSIMPQKQNPDVLELVQAKTAEVLGHQQTIATICTGQHSGYGRETQGVKQPLMDGLGTTADTLAVLADLVEELQIDADAVEDAIDPAIYAAYTANEQVEEGVPFREAYHDVKETGEYEQPDPGEVPSTAVDHEAVEEAGTWWDAEAVALQNTFDDLLDLAEANAAR